MELPVGNPKMPVSDPLPDEISLPGPSGADLVKMLVDSVAHRVGRRRVLQGWSGWSNPLRSGSPSGSWNEVPSPLPGSPVRSRMARRITG